ncbi:MAG: sulfatase [Myxococcota bacterium]
MSRPAPLTRRRFLGGVLGGFAVGVACGERTPSVERSGRPSFLVLVTDDQRADTLGCMGNPVIQTPSIDALAANGVIFDRAFVTTSSCPSSRASILTGQYTRRHGVSDFATPLPVAALDQSYPLLLRAHGYRTGFLGKWGLGGPLPWSAFDEWGGFAAQGAYFEGKGPGRRHLTGELASQAVDFLETGDERPFCLSISFKAPHGPWFFDPSLKDLYRDAPVPVGPTANLEAARGLHPFLRKSMVGHRGVRWLSDAEWLRDRLRDYYRMITGVDLAVARVLEALDRLGLCDEVVVIYTSDNGLMVGEHGFVGKTLMHEESIRVPLIVRAPGLPASAQGRRLKEMALNIDLAPTILDLAGIAAPTQMQGRSLLPLLEGDPVAWRDDWFYEFELSVGRGKYFPTLEGVRTERWKYVRYLDPEIEDEALYDLVRDPLETEDLADRPEHRERLDALRRRWQEYRDTVA